MDCCHDAFLRRCSDGAVDIGNDPAPVATADAFDKKADRRKCLNMFFPSNAFMASARSFNMFESMLQLGLID